MFEGPDAMRNADLDGLAAGGVGDDVAAITYRGINGTGYLLRIICSSSIASPARARPPVRNIFT